MREFEHASAAQQAKRLLTWLAHEFSHMPDSNTCGGVVENREDDNINANC